MLHTDFIEPTFSPKLRLTVQRLHIVVSWKAKLFMVTTHRTSNPISNYSSPLAFYIPACLTLLGLIILTIH
jgi:hypothetical protein